MGKDLKGKELGKGFVQRKNGIYYFRFTNKNGDRIGEYDSSLKELRKKVKKLLAEDELDKTEVNSNKTLNDMFDLSMNLYRVGELKERTIISYNNTYNRHIRNTIGKKKITSLRPKDIMIFFNKISQKYSLTVCRIIKACLVSAFDAATLEEIITSNFVKTIKIKSEKEQKKINALTIEEQKVFLKYAIESYFYNLYVLVLNTG